MGEEEKLTTYQIYLSILSVVTIAISIILLYNNIKSIRGEEKIFDDKTFLYISRINRLFILFIVLGFLIINYRITNYSNDKEAVNLQIYASYFAVIAAIIAVYVVFKDNYSPIADVENPNI